MTYLDAAIDDWLVSLLRSQISVEAEYNSSSVLQYESTSHSTRNPIGRQATRMYVCVCVCPVSHSGWPSTPSFCQRTQTLVLEWKPRADGAREEGNKCSWSTAPQRRTLTSAAETRNYSKRQHGRVRKLDCFSRDSNDSNNITYVPWLRFQSPLIDR